MARPGPGDCVGGLLLALLIIVDIWCSRMADAIGPAAWPPATPTCAKHSYSPSGVLNLICAPSAEETVEPARAADRVLGQSSKASEVCTSEMRAIWERAQE